MKLLKYLAIMLVVVGLGLALNVSLAQTGTSTTDQITALLAQIKKLEDQVASLRAQQQSLVGETRTLIKSYLQSGASGDEVKTLQELLAADPEVYPEKLITGYFGPLTISAVKKFQKKHGIEETGTVGPKTNARIHDLVTSGKIPWGHLIAPGYQKNFGSTTISTSTLGTKIPPGIAKKLGLPGKGKKATTTTATTTDTTAPVISGVDDDNTTATTTNINWETNEKATSKVWYGTSTPLSVSAGSTMVKSSGTLTKDHSLDLTGLASSTTYYYIVGSTDAAGNSATSSEESLTTESE